MDNRICISACAPKAGRGGLYTFEVTADGKLKPLDCLPVEKPMYTAVRENTVSVLTLQGFGEHSGLAEAAVSASGCFGPLSELISTRGVEACHLCVDEKDTYAVNYGSGSVIRLPDTTLVFSGCGPRADRQDAAHTHCVLLSPCGKYVLVTDLGADTVHVLDRSLRHICAVRVPAGHGARHIVFSPDGAYLYCANELAATVSVFAWNAQAGTLAYIHTFDSAVPAELAPHNTAAAIRLSKDGKKLYLSNRGEDTLTVFDTRDGVHFALVQKVPCGGSHPRDFQLTEDETHLVCANTFSDLVAVFALRDGLVGALTDSVSLPRPLCVMNL